MAAERANSVGPEGRLDDVIADYLEAVEAGITPDRRELLARHADLAVELRAFFADQDRFQELMGPLRAPSPVSPGVGPSSPAPLPAEGETGFGDYELLEEVGRGGMGVVFKARHLSLNRVVALKMILAGSHASPHDVQRFRLEAEAVAHLDHPNIVPVYEVGARDGQPFFTMKYVEGGSLARRLARGPRPATRELVRLLAKVARAMDHAHQRGVLHRDLKPANILISWGHAPAASGPEEGDELVPFVTDFGLAKRVGGRRPVAEEGQPAPSAGTRDGGTEGRPVDLPATDQRPDDLTLSGWAVGTPGYVAPERLTPLPGTLAAPATTSGDVYSLGAVLYECLVGRPPFRAPSPMETLVEVVRRPPEPPAAAARAAGLPPVAPDLEAVCLRCLQREPANRYPSAAALADDLERFLAGEPVSARRVAPPALLARWCRRNPLTAGLAAVLLAVLVGGVAVLAGLWRRAETNFRQAEENLEEAKRQQALAERNQSEAEVMFRLANRAVNDFLVTLSNRDLANIPGMQSVRLRMLESALTYYQNFPSLRGQDPRLRGDMANALYRVADLTAETGRRGEALTAFEQARDIFRELRREQPDFVGWQSELSHCLTKAAILYNETGRKDEALAAFREALELREQSARARPNDAAALADLAGAYNNMACQHGEAGRRDEALEHFRKSHELREKAAADPKDPSLQDAVALSYFNLGVHYGQHGPQRLAVESFQKAVALRERVVRDNPVEPQYRAGLAAALRAYGEHLASPAEALRQLDRGLALAEELARENPGVIQYQGELAAVWVVTGIKRRANNQPEEALAAFDKAIGILEKLAQREPRILSFSTQLAATLSRAGSVHQSLKDNDAAVRAFEKARDVQTKIVQAAPDAVEARSDLAGTLQDLGVVLGRLGRFDEAVAALREAVRHQGRAVERAPAFRRKLGGHLGWLGHLLRSAGKPAEAAEAVRQRQKNGADDAAELYAVARDFSLTASAVGGGKPGLTAEQQKERDGYLGEALGALRQAVAAGFKDADRARQDPALAPLGDRPDFEQLFGKPPG